MISTSYRYEIKIKNYGIVQICMHMYLCYQLRVKDICRNHRTEYSYHALDAF
jgi:hypothetical protein